MTLKSERLQSGKEKILPEPVVVIEIGAGQASAVPELFPLAVENSGGNRATYIPVNIDKDELEIVKDEHPDALPVQANMFQLPFKHESAEQIWILNVFGDPELEIKKAKRRSVVASALSECAPILKKGGTIVIGEFYTPAIASALKYYTETKLMELGLRRIALHVGEDAISFFDDFGKCVPLHTREKWLERESGDKPFFLVLEKT